MEEVGRVHEGSVDAVGGWGQQVTLMVKKSRREWCAPDLPKGVDSGEMSFPGVSLNQNNAQVLWVGALG